MVRMRKLIIINIIVEDEKFDILLFFGVFFIIVLMGIANKIARNIFDFFVDFFSLGANEAAYIKRVIIPEENTKIVTNGNHLFPIEVYVSFATIRDVLIIKTAVTIGVFSVINKSLAVIINIISFVNLLIYKINVLCFNLQGILFFLFL